MVIVTHVFAITTAVINFYGPTREEIITQVEEKTYKTSFITTPRSALSDEVKSFQQQMQELLCEVDATLCKKQGDKK